MAALIPAFTATVPAGTAKSAPIRFDMSMPPSLVQAVEIDVPPGSSGAVGFAVQNSGVTVIPYQSDQFIVTTGTNIRWPLENQITSGSWQLLAYNTGAFPHTLYVRFLLGLLPARTGPHVSPTVPIAAQVVTGGPSQADLAALLDATGP